MTESDWNRCTDPQAMLKFLRTSGKASERKLRLFACACSRRFLHLSHDPRVQEAVNVAERFADGLARDSERSDARKAAQLAAEVRGVIPRPEAPKWERRVASLAYYAVARQGIETARNMFDLAVEVLVWQSGGHNVCDWQAIKAKEGLIQCGLLREVFGPLPFRELLLDPNWLAWNDGIVRRLAEAVYENRELPSGHVDRAGLAALAHALEEAGSTTAELLTHLRSPGPHYRGSFALDLILGKS